MEFRGVNYSTYYAKHIFGENEIYFIVNLDLSTKAFSVIPINKEEYTTKISETIATSNSQEDKVERNEYNIIPYKYYEEEDVVDRYLQDYIELALFNPEIAYEKLDEEYKTKKFQNYESFKNYVNNNREKLETMCKSIRKQYTDFETYQEYEEYYSQVSKMDLQQYKVENNMGTKRYICIDGNGSYYIFDVNSIMNYTLILDTYTIDLPEFVEKYNEANSAEKAGMNLEKVMNALADKDYKYVYDKLDETFKANKFPTQADFEKYVQENLYSYIETEFSNYKNSGELHMYDVTFKDKANEKNEAITKTFIIKLLEGTDFVISFNV